MDAVRCWLTCAFFWSSVAWAQPDEEPAEPPAPVPSTRAERTPAPEAVNVPDVVEVAPVARDEQIVDRLTKILQATGWFQNVHVHVDEGVVFLGGLTSDQDHRDWATALARRTRDVVAVVNQMELVHPSPWDFRPAAAGLSDLWYQSIRSIPYLALALGILLLTTIAAKLSYRLAERASQRRIPVPLLQKVIAGAVAAVVFLIGLYLVLKVCGLTRLALTVLGGTGLFGLVIGIAFRDITENFLASILLSVQRPFRTGDLIEVADNLGYVQQLNVRTTVIMSLTGQHIQLPNALVYKTMIRNFTTNPNRREEFVLALSSDYPIAAAQEAAVRVLNDHPSVLKDPDPWVLVDSIAPEGVYLRVYFWMDGKQHSWLKVRSSVMRLMKRAFEENHIPLANMTQTMVFPKGVPMLSVDNPPPPNSAYGSDASRSGSDHPSLQAEGGLESDAEQIGRQAPSDPGSKAENLLRAGTE